MKVSALFVSCLQAHGVTHIFGVPGEETLDLVESLRTSDIQLVITRNEQTAVFMAATYGRLTGKTGVALATLGPWATNMMTGVAYAQLGGMPVMVITGQKPIKKSKQGRFQVIDVVAMMKPITKYSTNIIDGARVASTLAHAFATAEAEKPGAVHIELAEDIAGEQVPTDYQPIVFDKIRRPIPDDKAIHALLQQLQQAHRPIILVGAGANRRRITNYLTKFVQKHNIPFFSSQMGKGVIDERLPQYIGTAALTSGDGIHEAIAQADLIIAIGHDTIEKPTHLIEQGKTQVVHINFVSAEFDELYKPSLQIIGDIGHTLRRLYEADMDTSNRNFNGIYESALRARAALEANVDANCCSQTLTPGKLVRDVRAVIQSNDIVALDNGLYKVRFARNYRCHQANTLLLDNALATMGAGYASALMTKMLHPEQKVVAIVGDGGLVMNLGDIATAVASGLDLVIVVLNDGAYGMIKRKQHNHGMTDFGLDLHNPDFVQLAESFGATGYRITDPMQFQQTLADAIQQPGIVIIDVPFSYPAKIE